MNTSWTLFTAHGAVPKASRKNPNKPLRMGRTLSSSKSSFSHLPWLVPLGQETPNRLEDKLVPKHLFQVNSATVRACSNDTSYLLFLPTTSVNPSSSTLGWTFALGVFTSAGASSISISLSPSSSSISSLSQSVSSSSSS